MFRKRTLAIILPLFLLAFAAAARFGVFTQRAEIQPVTPPPSHQDLLREELLAGDFDAQLQTLRAIRKLDPAAVQPALREAMRQVLLRCAETTTNRTQAVVRGEDPEVFGDPSDLIFRMIPVVWSLHDPAFIPALSALLEFQPASYEALASFGEQAVPSLVEVAMSPQSRSGQVRGALIGLRFIVEPPAAPTLLTAPSREEIGRVATRYLIGRDQVEGELLPEAIDLAIALYDPGLRKIVESYASDREALISRGVQDPRRIQHMQRYASDRLRGVPAHKPQGIAHYLQP